MRLRIQQLHGGDERRRGDRNPDANHTVHSDGAAKPGNKHGNDGFRDHMAVLRRKKQILTGIRRDAENRRRKGNQKHKRGAVGRMAADTGCEYRDVVFHSEADMVRLKPQAVQRQIVPVEFPARLLAADFPVHGGKHRPTMCMFPMGRRAGRDEGDAGAV